MKEGKQLANAACAALWMVASASMSTAHAAGGIGEPDAQFRRLDTDHDGYISHEEAKQNKEFDRVFKKVDGNGDDLLGPDEFVKAQSINERLHVRQYVGDSMITARIKTALLKDKRVNGLDVKVETYEGTVLLSGFVDNEQQAQRAAEIASNVQGVVTVKNSLLVKG